MKTNNCIKNLLKMICVLQRNSKVIESTKNDCTRRFLGPNINNICYNTRVITLYNKQGELFSVLYDDNGSTETSSTFRVIDVNNDSCTLLILKNEDDEYISTNQTLILNISCICAVKCNGDVIVNNL